jgi:ATP-dependent protease ClpP protease subunit
MRFGNNTSKEEEKPKAVNDDEGNVDVHNVDNNIYFYTDVNKESILELNKSIKTVTTEMLHTANLLSINPPPVILHINSPGGSLLDAFAAIDYIDRNEVPIRSIVEGMAASAATLLSVSASVLF